MRLSSLSLSKYSISILTLAAFAAASALACEKERREGLFELAFEPLDDLDFELDPCFDDVLDLVQRTSSRDAGFVRKVSFFVR